MTRRSDKQYYRSYIAHLWQDIQGLLIPGTLSINTTRAHDYGPSSNNTCVDAPTVRSQRPTSPERKSLSNALIPTSRKAHFSMSQWTSSQTYQKVKNTTVSSQLSTKDALRQQNSYPVTKQLMDQASHGSISPTWYHSLDCQRESSPTEIHSSPASSPLTSIKP